MEEDSVSIVGLIPLRGPLGGTRMGGGKEARMLGQWPLMAWTIRSAIDSGAFDSVIAIVADEQYASMAEDYGAMVPFRRPEYTVRDGSPDIEWILWVMKQFSEEFGAYDAFGILRVTSPFLAAQDIEDGWTLFRNSLGAHSLRTVAKANQDPMKMWVIRNDRLLPLLPTGPESIPWHSRPSQENPTIYAQTAGMEFAWTDMVLDTKTIAGSVIVPYVVDGFAAMDLNSRLDWDLAETAIKNGEVEIPKSLK